MDFECHILCVAPKGDNIAILIIPCRGEGGKSKSSSLLENFLQLSWFQEVLRKSMAVQAIELPSSVAVVCENPKGTVLKGVKYMFNFGFYI